MAGEQGAQGQLRQQLATAVRDLRAVRFRYVHAPEAAGERICHPHVLFESSGGAICLDAVQVAGPSSSGSPPGWRTFRLDHVRDLTVTGRRFAVDPEFNLAASKYHHVISAVPAPAGNVTGDGPGAPRKRPLDG